VAPHGRITPFEREEGRAITVKPHDAYRGKRREISGTMEDDGWQRAVVRIE